MKTLFSILGIISCITAIAQSKGNLKGVIVNEKNEPLISITIELQPLHQRTATDENGQFFLTEVPAGNYTVLVTGIGFQARKENILINSGKTNQLFLQLNAATHTLQEVVIQATRFPSNTTSLTRTSTPLKEIPQQVQIIDRSVLNDQQPLYLNDAFKFAAGITATDYYGGFSSRGYTTGISGITTNGIKGVPYPEGQLPLMGNIESVEVIHGPTAIMNGPGGLGGNVNMVTKQPKKYTTVNASIAAGSFDLYRAQAELTGSINKKKNLYFLAGAGWQNGGSFTTQFDRRSIQLYGSLKWDISPRTSWQLNTNYINDNASNNYQPRVPIFNSMNKDSIFLVPYNFNPGTDSRYKGNNFQLQSIMEHCFNEHWKLNLLAAYNEARSERAQYVASGFVRPGDLTVFRSYSWQTINSPQTSVNLYVTGQVSTGPIKHQFIAGGDALLSRNNYPNGILQYAATPVPVFTSVKEEQYDSTGMTRYYNTNMEKFTYNVLGAYVQDQIKLFSKLSLLAGLRYNNYFRRYVATRKDGTIQNDEKPLRTENFSPRLGLIYQPVSDISVYLNYNEGFQPQYGNFAERGGPFDPETSKEYELGAKGELLHGLLQPSIAIYQSAKKNVLQSAPRDGFPNWQEAIGEVQSRGIEMGTKAILFKSLLLIVNYNYNKTKITESKKPEDIGQLFANSPENSANGWARYSVTNGVLKGLFFGGGFQYVDRRYFSNKKVNVTNIPEMPSYTVFDAMAGYRYQQYSLQVNGNNLADKRYALSGIANSYTPGMPRNFLVTLSYSFK